MKRKAMLRMHVVMLVCSLSYLMKVRLGAHARTDSFAHTRAKEIRMCALQLAMVIWLLIADLSGQDLGMCMCACLRAFVCVGACRHVCCVLTTA